MYSKIFHNKFSTLFSVVLVLLAGFGLYQYHAQAEGEAGEKKIIIGIIMPMDHMALREIVEGFKERLLRDAPQAVQIKVQNAQGDMNLQHSIIQQFINEKVDVLVPIGTAATQMTLAMAKTQPIVSLAAEYTEQERQAHTNLTGILDEIGPERPLDFMKIVFPNLKKISLVYSNSEKVFPEVAALMAYAPLKGIQLQKVMIQALPDLYTLAHRIDADSEALFVLKDHLIVSGIPTVVQEASTRNIPLITSDEGSVMEGALFALGVQEKTIGILGAERVIQVLKGIPMQDLPLKSISNLSVFYNEHTGSVQKFDGARLHKLATEHQYGWVSHGSP